MGIVNTSIRSRLVESVKASILIRPAIIAISLCSSVIVARLLGPELMAIKVAFLAASTGLVVVCDFGLSRSLGKILPDISVKRGSLAANEIGRRIYHLKLVTTLCGFLVVVIAESTGMTDFTGTLSLKAAFFVLLFLRLLVSIPVQQLQSVGQAAFRARELYRLELLISFLTPAAVITSVFIYRNPYAVIIAGIIPQCLYLWLLSRSIRYDLDDEHVTEDKPVSIRTTLDEYKSYVLMTYTIFLFNRFVIRIPLLFAVLSLLGQPPAVLSNAAIAVMLVSQAWALTNLPIAGMRAPLLTRMYAQENEKRFLDAQRTLLTIVLLTSSILIIVIATIGEPLLLSLYGLDYASGIKWGVIASAVALFGNCLCMGNSTLHQRGCFAPELWGIAGAVVFLSGGIVFCVSYLPEHDWAFGVLLVLVLGRIIFWSITDIWAETQVLKWQGSSIKLTALTAVMLSIFVTRLIVGEDSSLVTSAIGCFVALLFFWGIFRVLGGVGTRSREILATLLPARHRWVVCVV